MISLAWHQILQPKRGGSSSYGRMIPKMDVWKIWDGPSALLFFLKHLWRVFTHKTCFFPTAVRLVPQACSTSGKLHLIYGEEYCGSVLRCMFSIFRCMIGDCTSAGWTHLVSIVFVFLSKSWVASQVVDRWLWSSAMALDWDSIFCMLSVWYVYLGDRHKLIWPSLDWDAPRSMDCTLKCRETCNRGFVWAFQYHHRNLRGSHADAFFKRQEEVWTYGSQLQWEDCPIDLTITLALCRL